MALISPSFVKTQHHVILLLWVGHTLDYVTEFNLELASASRMSFTGAVVYLILTQQKSQVPSLVPKFL